MDGRDPLFSLTAHLVLLSLLAVGGINSILPELHRVVVLTEGWLSNDEFTALFALSQAAPGPNVIFITVIGWRIGGLGGAFLATLAICGPAVLIAAGTARVWAAWGTLPWFRLLQNGLLPLTTGLVIAGAWLLTAAAAQDWRSYGVTAATAAVVLAAPKLNPLWLLGAAALLGIGGVV